MCSEEALIYYGVDFDVAYLLFSFTHPGNTVNYKKRHEALYVLHPHSQNTLIKQSSLNHKWLQMAGVARVGLAPLLMPD